MLYVVGTYIYIACLFDMILIFCSKNIHIVWDWEWLKIYSAFEIVNSSPSTFRCGFGLIYLASSLFPLITGYTDKPSGNTLRSPFCACIWETMKYVPTVNDGTQRTQLRKTEKWKQFISTKIEPIIMVFCSQTLFHYTSDGLNFLFFQISIITILKLIKK